MMPLAGAIAWAPCSWRREPGRNGSASGPRATIGLRRRVTAPTAACSAATGDVLDHRKFNGRTVPLRDAKGLRDLAVLLAAPGREVAATELVAGVRGGAATAIAALGADPVLDDRALAAYRARLADLHDEQAQADALHDIERSARLAAERDALIDELTHAAGLGGRRRRLGDVTERARTTVTARIRDAIGRIERAHPELGRHLRASIVTGARCAYRPAETVRWTISQS